MNEKWEQHQMFIELEEYAMSLDDEHREQLLDILNRLQRLVEQVEATGRTFPNELIKRMVDKIG